MVKLIDCLTDDIVKITREFLALTLRTPQEILELLQSQKGVLQ